MLDDTLQCIINGKYAVAFIKLPGIYFLVSHLLNWSLCEVTIQKNERMKLAINKILITFWEDAIKYLQMNLFYLEVSEVFNLRKHFGVARSLLGILYDTIFSYCLEENVYTTVT